jgi:hypothetical protein
MKRLEKEMLIKFIEKSRMDGGVKIDAAMRVFDEKITHLNYNNGKERNSITMDFDGETGYFNFSKSDIIILCFYFKFENRVFLANGFKESSLKLIQKNEETLMIKTSTHIGKYIFSMPFLRRLKIKLHVFGVELTGLVHEDNGEYYVICRHELLPESKNMTKIILADTGLSDLAKYKKQLKNWAKSLPRSKR